MVLGTVAGCVISGPRLLGATLLARLGYGTVCVVGTGVGLNQFFYDTSLKRYEETYRLLFSQPDAQFIQAHMDLLQERELAIFLDTFMYPIGAGIGSAIKSSWHWLKNRIIPRITYFRRTL